MDLHVVEIPIAYLYGRQFLCRFSGDIGGSKTRPADTVLTRRTSHEDHRIPLPLRRSADGLPVLEDTDTHSIHERIGMITVFKINFPANGRHPEAIPVVPDPMHNPR